MLVEPRVARSTATVGANGIATRATRGSRSREETSCVPASVRLRQRGPETCIFAFGKCSQSFVCRLNAENSALDICPGTVCLTVVRAFRTKDARGTSSKLILYGTLLENTVEFVRAFARLQSLVQTYAKNKYDLLYA